MDLANRWGARPSNLFESYYRKMNTPTCDRLKSNDNLGFPKGISIRNLCVCKPDTRCLSVPSPRYYADKKANSEGSRNKITYKAETCSNAGKAA